MMIAKAIMPSPKADTNIAHGVGTWLPPMREAVPTAAKCCGAIVLSGPYATDVPSYYDQLGGLSVDGECLITILLV
jgi:hypothetical protein